MSEIILEVHRPVERRVGETVRLSREAAAAIEQLITETGLSARTIASELIVQAARQVEIREVS